jgi:Zn-dependent protease with chaperone function
MFRGSKTVEESAAEKTASSAASAGSSSASMFSGWKWRLFLRISRIARIIGVGYGIYTVGYANGLHDYIENPQKQMDILVASVLKTSGSNSTYDETDVRVQRLIRIGERVTTAARRIVEEDIKLLEEEANTLKTKVVNAAGGEGNGKTADPSPEEIRVVALLSEKQELLARISGQWHFFLTDSPHINAFVADSFPKTIFVNEGMLDKLHPTDDELAVVMSHEMSHFIHSHNKARAQFQFLVYLTQLVLFAVVDPLGGASFVFDMVVSDASKVLLATHSRESEEEADMTGLKIAAKACYNTLAGVEVFNKLAKAAENKNHVYSWLDSHPASDYRAQYLLEASATYNAAPDCMEVQKDLQKAQKFYWWQRKHAHGKNT